ncbi:MAG: ATP-dependent zinc metalloprotease FtsH [Candidatus Anoxychlamydiales bacterium]|nr:ATP-dependent zinc metalloprotease FtsH [Candidatus Anoxychlamydiales bacterium]
MNEDRNQKEPRKGFPGGFLLFVVAVILIILTVQTLTSDKLGKVSFSHQLEHLVNLDLLKPDSNKKVAQNDNLVTFSSKFREATTQDGENRFNYLTLLNQKHEFTAQDDEMANELTAQKKNVIKSAELFLYASGIDLSESSFNVISSSYDAENQQNSIIINSLPKKNIPNLKTLKEQFVWVKHNPSLENTSQMQKDLTYLTDTYRSASVGIGTESIKQSLKKISSNLATINSSTSLNQRITIFNTSLTEISSIVSEIIQNQDGTRLLQLRSIRAYIETLQRYDALQKQVNQNLAMLSNAREKVASDFWFFNDKEISTKALERQDADTFSHWYQGAKKEWGGFSSNQGLSVKAAEQPRNLVLEKQFTSQEPTPNYFNYIFTFLPIIIVVLLLYYLFTRQMKGGGSSAMNFGKSPARLLTKETNKVTFKDVAGAEEAKEELEEIVDFLKDPQKYTTLGARIPKGVLLVGPPGTGKTLVAKAVAGEADRPFFSISGSDFVEMFVGVGAARVRDLFAQAKKNSPCIIFMDEIDAVGRHRGAGIGGGHDEREQTLNQLLVEMDGFDTKEGVILMAATNRPDILDKALLRPGRFDRRVMLDLPDVKGRYEILKVHARKIKIDPSVNLMDIAKSTPGSSGADLENILNEAALLAARKARKAVTSQEAREACDKVRFGKERRSLEMDESEKKTTAYHESGHAIVGLVVKHADPVEKVTIIPRGFSLGATHFMPQKNRLNYWKKEVLDQLAICMGGRVSEELFLDDMTSGAQQDISQATKLARAMVCEWGMSDLGTVAYGDSNDNNGNRYLGLQSSEKSYSDETAKLIDKEIKALLDAAYKAAYKIVEDNKDKVEIMAKYLIKFETLYADDVKEIMEGSFNEEKKSKRLKDADALQKKPPPPPPPIEDNPTPKDNGPKPQEA